MEVISKLVQRVRTFLGARFEGSQQYWENRYQAGGNSGSGSYGRLAAFKAQVLNDFVEKNGIQTVVELGCGDGNQLRLAKYPSYLGLDVSHKAIELCQKIFKGDSSKTFAVYGHAAKVPAADMLISLDVIYHLVEDDVFLRYIDDLFRSSRKYVIIYSSNQSEKQVYHERMRDFKTWVRQRAPEFSLIQEIKNPYPFDATDPDNTSQSDFFIYQRMHQ
jgi:SAM-dependent methyltransferase